MFTADKKQSPSLHAHSDVDAALLEQAFLNSNASIGVIGLGYVGLPLVSNFVRQNFTVFGFDIDQTKVDALNDGQSYIKHIPSSDILELVETKRFTATNDFSHLTKMDAIVICVPTPLTKQREPDLSYIVKTTEVISKYLRKGQLITLESTTYPGTTREVMIPILERNSGLISGVDFFVAFSPEREDPGNEVFSANSTPKVVGGCGADALKLACALYGKVTPKVVPVSSADTAEAVKLTENIFRAVNIALVNELKVIYNAMGIDVWEVIDAAKTKPFGFMPFYPGPGLGGHCIPIDPFYLTWKAREFDISTRFIELAGEVNRSMPFHVVGRLGEALNRRFAKGLNGAKILMLGLAYKKNVDDMRESPSLKIIEIMEQKGAIVNFYDPYFSIIPKLREHPALIDRKGIDLNVQNLKQFDAVFIATDHDDVDYNMVVEHAKLVIDTRNVLERLNIHSDKIVKA
jgi:UDP-N-acetyl-D-glucosamine dehydrogenase